MSSIDTKPTNLAIVIPAGGGGTRLWPRSRQSTPKQFLDLVSDRTLLQETVDRVVDLAPADRIFVITSHKHIAQVRKQLPKLPPENIIGEPVGRESAPAVGLMAALLERKLGPDTTMVVLPADHFILDQGRFRERIYAAASAAREGYLVTIGIPPKGPDTGFGYIHSGGRIDIDGDGEPVLLVRQFKEKPHKELAEEYLATGEYFWNAGMYIVTVAQMRSLFRTHLPGMEEGFAKIVDGIVDGDPSVLAEVFPTLQKISFDYAIAEHADRVAVVPADIGWNDVGSWSRLAEVLADGKHDDDVNIVVGDHVCHDTHGALIYSPGRLVATIGLDDIVVIQTDDATLICPKSRAEEVKHIVEALKKRGDHHLL